MRLAACRFVNITKYTPRLVRKLGTVADSVTIKTNASVFQSVIKLLETISWPIFPKSKMLGVRHRQVELQAQLKS